MGKKRLTPFRRPSTTSLAYAYAPVTQLAAFLGNNSLTLFKRKPHSVFVEKPGGTVRKMKISEFCLLTGTNPVSLILFLRENGGKAFQGIEDKDLDSFASHIAETIIREAPFFVKRVERALLEDKEELRSKDCSPTTWRRLKEKYRAVQDAVKSTLEWAKHQNPSLEIPPEVQEWVEKDLFGEES